MTGTVEKKASKPAKVQEHPKYSDMIKEAIAALKERGGSSRQAIVKYIKANYKVADNVEVYLRSNLKRMAAKNVIVHTKGIGASGSFKVKKEEKPKKKKKVVKKPAVKKPAVKKPTVKNTKKPAAKKEKDVSKKEARPKKPAEAKPEKEKEKKPTTKKTAKPKAAPKSKPAKKDVKKPAAKKAAKSPKKKTATKKGAAKK